MFKSLAVFTAKNLSGKNFYCTKPPVIEIANENLLFKKLLKESNDANYIIPEISERDLKDTKPEQWRGFLKAMRPLGFSQNDCFIMASVFPSVLTMETYHLENVVQQWQLAELGYKNLKKILKNQPMLLKIGEQEILVRVPYFRSFLKSCESVATVLSNSPNVMFDDWKYTLEKLNYLHTEKLINVNQLLRSQALSKSLDFIKFRFDIAEKCGVFKQKSKYDFRKNKNEKNKNPTLSQLVDLSDQLFANKIAKITLEEYEVYKDMYEMYGDDDEHIDD